MAKYEVDGAEIMEEDCHGTPGDWFNYDFACRSTCFQKHDPGNVCDTEGDPGNALCVEAVETTQLACLRTCREYVRRCMRDLRAGKLACQGNKDRT